jgi:hypothetical protein
MYRPDQPGTVYLVPDPFEQVEPNPARWLDKTFFKVERPRSISVQFANATNSWKLTRETPSSPWQLADPKPGEQLDSAKAAALAYPLASASFDDVLTTTPAGAGPDGHTVIDVSTFDGFDYVLKVGEKKDEYYDLTFAVSAALPAERTPGKDEKPADKDKLDQEFKATQKQLGEKLAQETAGGKWSYLVSSWTMDPLLKTRAELLVEKQNETKSPEPVPTATGLEMNKK